MLLKQDFINELFMNVKVFKPTKADSQIMIYNHSALRMLLRVSDKVRALPDLHCSLFFSMCSGFVCKVFIHVVNPMLSFSKTAHIAAPT